MTQLEASALYVALSAQERRVLRLVLPNRRAASPIVRAAGLEVRHFSQDDHRLIFAGWQVACEHDLPLIDTLRLIRSALESAGLWDADAPAGSGGMVHSDAMLARLGTHEVTDEELDYAVGWGPSTDPLTRAIARHVVALVEASEALERGRV
jgi:hypothetical protein